MTYSVAFTTPLSAPAWKRWLVLSPVARIVIYAAVLIGATYIGVHIGHMFSWTSKAATPLQRAIAGFVTELIAVLLLYVILVRVIEHRRVRELSLRDLPTFGMAGFIAGFLLLSTVTGLLWLFGSYHVLGTNPQADWLPALLSVGLAAGVAEEVIVRGVLFRITEEGLGTWWALAISALFFGGAHLGNPNATLWSSLAIAIEAGILLALVYHLTRSLWASIGLHAAWNFTQGTIYGIPVSGYSEKGWLISTRTGPNWLSGGEFGAEASAVAVIFCACLSAVLLVIAIRRKTIVPPSWVRRRQAAASVG